MTDFKSALRIWSCACAADVRMSTLTILPIGLNAQIPFKRCVSFAMCAANTVALTIRFGRSPRMCDCRNRIVEEVSENEYD